MVETTQAIVIHSIKYGDSDLITSCYTKSKGIKSYLLRGILKSTKGKVKKAYFQPLTQLFITANHRKKSNLNFIKDAEINHFYESIHSDIKKQAIAVFIAEILHYSIKEEEANTALFSYLETSFLWLDTHEHIANFHIIFLLNLSKYLGFYPDLSGKETLYFDLLDGKYTYKKTPFVILGEKLTLLKTMLGTNFEASHKVDLSAHQRQELLLVLVRYFDLHISNFKEPKSLSILKMIFN